MTVCPTCDRPLKTEYKGIPARKSVTYTLKLPKDEAEDGLKLFREELKAAGKTIVKTGLYVNPPPAYYILISALIFFNEHVLSVDGHATD